MDSFLSQQYQDRKNVNEPLWLFYVLNNLADGRSCLVANIDHCIGDGITMVNVLLSILDDNDNDILPSSTADSTPGHPMKPVSTSLSSLSAIDKFTTVVTGFLKGCIAPFLPGSFVFLSHNVLEEERYLS